MGSEWPEIALTDAYSISSGLSKPANEFGSGYPFLAFKDVFYNTFVPAELTQLVQSSEKEQAACSIKRGDVFLTRTSETMNELGMSAVALKDYEKATFNGFTKRLRPKAGNGLHPEYVAYFLRSPRFRAEMMAFSTMSTRASLNNDMIGRLKISVPPLEIQRSIASILKTLDDKIELNRQMNTTLEAMAQALFKSWFVDFDPVIDNALTAGNPIPDELAERAERRAKAAQQQSPTQPHTLPAAIRRQFPDRFVFTETMGWVPEGWLINRADEVASITIGKTPPRKESHWFSENRPRNLVWVSIRDMGRCGVFIGDSNEYLTQEAVDKHNVKVTPANSVLLSFKLTIGRVAISRQELCTNEAIAHLASYKRGLNQQYLYCYLKNFDFSQLGSTSSIATAVNSKLIKAMPILTPMPSNLTAFEEATHFYFEKLAITTDQIESLTAIRDTLLPKLLSGQLRIPEAEQMLAEAL